jgi:hypothetical protein
MKKFTAVLLTLITFITISTPAFAQDTAGNAPESIQIEAEVNEEQLSAGEESYAANVSDSFESEDAAENDDESLLSDAVVAIMYMCVSGPHAPYIFGHTWICIKNVTEKNLKVGNTEIAPGAMASFGLHHFDGLHYDDEMYDYSGETVNATECKLTRRDLKSAEEEITNSRWHWYEYLTHNCTNFATSVWKKVTGKGFFVFCFPFVVQIQMAKEGLKKINIERQEKKAAQAPATPAPATPAEA